MNRKGLMNIVLVLAVVIILGVGGYYVGSGKSSPIDAQMSESEILTDQSAATSTFVGYYVLEKGVYGEENAGPFDCDSFNVFKSSDPLFQSFSSLAIEGNTVNKLVTNGDLLVAINFDDVDKITKEKIIKSTKYVPISIVVKKVEFEGKGMPACGSFVRIISVN